jgi:hypothetical protein
MQINQNSNGSPSQSPLHLRAFTKWSIDRFRSPENHELIKRRCVPPMGRQTVSARSMAVFSLLPQLQDSFFFSECCGRFAARRRAFLLRRANDRRHGSCC